MLSRIVLIAILLPVGTTPAWLLVTAAALEYVYAVLIMFIVFSVGLGLGMAQEQPSMVESVKKSCRPFRQGKYESWVVLLFTVTLIGLWIYHLWALPAAAAAISWAGESILCHISDRLEGPSQPSRGNGRANGRKPGSDDDTASGVDWEEVWSRDDDENATVGD